jgi:hypothetical protein
MATMLKIVITIVCIGLAVRCICSAQVSSTPPRYWKNAYLLEFGFGSFDRLELSYNRQEAVRREVSDSNLLRRVAKSCGLTTADLAGVRIVTDRDGTWVYQIGNSEKAFNALSEKLGSYVRARQQGHTPAFALATLTNRAAPSTISDPDLRAIASNRPLLPVSWLKRVESGTGTNKAGQTVSHTISTKVVNGRTVTNETKHIPQVDEVYRWVSYALIDGEIAWRYFLRFTADGSLEDVSESRCDAKEYDPKYRKPIKDVEAQVAGEMKRDGSFGQFGSVHTFWHLKQEKLKERGIQWRSPAELNPNTSYD